MAGVEILTGVAYERIEPGAVVIRDAGGAERRVAADTVVIAAGQEPETALARSLAGAGTPHIVIGGAGGAERTRRGTGVQRRRADTGDGRTAHFFPFGLNVSVRVFVTFVV